jgi:phenylacetate-CoA ligase
MFDIDRLPTLVVNCLPMGVIFRSKATAIANLSVREDMACSILRDIGPRFQQTLLCTDPVFIRCLLDEGRRAGVDWRALNTSAIMGEEVMVEAQRDYFARALGIDLDTPGHRTIGSTYGMGELGLNLLFESRDTIRIRRHLWRRQGPLAGGRLAERDAFGLFCFNPLRCHPEILEPDAEGYGELVLTLLDTRATILLPRYSTGDVARLIPADEARAMAQAAGTAPPWLPMIALKGRIKDRPPGQPSVESIKEWLYTDHELAGRLTGAFRLSTLADTDQFRLVVQAHPANAHPLHELAARLLALLHPADRAAAQVEIVPATEFEWRPVLDFERKFVYRAN